VLHKALLILIVTALLLPGLCPAQDTTSLEPAGDSMLLSNIQLFKGHQYRRQGDVEKATECYLRAARYMRTSPEPHFALARVYVGRSVMDAFLEFATGIKFMITDFFYQSLLVSNLVLILFVAFGIAIYAATLVTAARHAKAVWYSVILTVSSVFSGWYLKALLLGCVSAFFILLSGKSIIGVTTWTALVGSALAWRFSNTSERKVIVAFTVFLIMFGVILGVNARLLSTQHPDSPLRLVALADRMDDDRLSRSLVAASGRSGFDPIKEFMKGLVYLREGNNLLAIEGFTLASKFAQNNASILNNLGVAHHNLGRYEEAKIKFEEALRLGPREATIHYNYSQTLNALLQYDLAQEELGKASTLDFELTRRLVTDKKSLTLVPMNLQTRVLWQLAADPENQMLRLSYHPTESGVVGTLILILVSSLALVLMRKAKVPARCDICGALVQKQVVKRKRKELLCDDCDAIKARNADNNNQLEEDLENKLRRRGILGIIRMSVLGLLVPGSCYMLTGRRSRGFAISVAMYCLLILAASGGILIRPVPHFGVNPTSGWALPVFIVAYCLYVWRSTVLTIRSVNEQ
jgi:tetratricopeptide (TPR) repeat protein